MTTRNDWRLNRSEPVEAKGKTQKHWRTRGVQVSVLTREDAGVEADEPWIASCDTHGEMVSCDTKRIAIEAARSGDFCSGCRSTTR